MTKLVRDQIQLFLSGANCRAHQVLGAHGECRRGRDGFLFRTWAPRARSISLVGDFNGWDRSKTPMKQDAETGVWEVFVPGLQPFAIYKYSVEDTHGAVRLKADPFAFDCEMAPATASRLAELEEFRWTDKRWLGKRSRRNPLHDPVNIYEIHPGSWRRHPDGTCLNYAQLGAELAEYLPEMGYTHVELMPVTEHSQDHTWGYQTTGYFSSTGRYGSPLQLMQLVNTLHKAGIGVILDWVPGYFARDEHGLAHFDGSPCFESGQPRDDHRDPDGVMFDLTKPPVRSFLLSSAFFWLEQYHMDGLRVGDLSSLLYLDYGRPEWQPNLYGGRENLDGAEFVKHLNTQVLTAHPDVMMIGEEATSWPLVTKPPYGGGLGFHFKWNTGWMADTLSYMELDPWFRSYNHDKLTFSMFYAFSENFVLPISHNEVAPGKKSLIERMPGEYGEKFAGLRTFLGYTMSHPGKKLLFMGNEFGQFQEWDYHKELDWMLLDYEAHRQMKDYVRDLNHFYLENPCLWQVEEGWEGFRWIVPDDNSQNIVVFRRMDEKENELVVICNFAPVERRDYRFGVMEAEGYRVAFSSADARYGGPGGPEDGILPCEEQPSHGMEHSVSIHIPPMCAMWLRPVGLVKKRGTIPSGGKRPHRQESSE